MDKVFAIVVTYNGEVWIRKCLDSLQSSLIPVHIIVVDNKSADKTIDIVENEYPKVQLIKSDKNLGFGQGNNIGLRIALKENADYIFLLNQDAWIEPNTLQAMIEIHQKNHQFGILSSLHFDGSGINLDWYFAKIINPDDCPNFISDIFTNQIKELYQIEFIHAAAWLISKKCLETVGVFDPIFPHYGEDNDFADRAKLKDFKIGICPSVKIFHDAIKRNQNEIQFNYKLQIVFAILALKNIQGRFLTNIVFYTKNNIDLLTSLLLYRQFKKFKFRLKIFLRSFLYLRKIKLSRKMSFKEKAFI